MRVIFHRLWTMAMDEKSPSRGEIFVVDDDPAVRETLSMVLSAGGYQVLCFANRAALFAAGREKTPPLHPPPPPLPPKTTPPTFPQFPPPALPPPPLSFPP